MINESKIKVGDKFEFVGGSWASIDRKSLLNKGEVVVVYLIKRASLEIIYYYFYRYKSKDLSRFMFNSYDLSSKRFIPYKTSSIFSDGHPNTKIFKNLTPMVGTANNC